MAAVVFQHVARVYPDGIRAVDDLTLAVGDGEFVVIVGPSGSGKRRRLFGWSAAWRSIADAALAREPHEDRLLHGTVEPREELGPELFVHFSASDVQLAETATIAELPRDTGALRASSDSSAVLVGRFGPDSAVREGGSVDAVVDTGRLHFFDPETGRGIYAIDKEGAIT